MKPAQHPSALRIQQLLAAAGVDGVSPLGHANPVRMLLDADLQRFRQIWAAAGTPFSVFPLSPAELSSLTGAGWSDIKED